MHIFIQLFGVKRSSYQVMTWHDMTWHYEEQTSSIQSSPYKFKVQSTKYTTYDAIGRMIRMPGFARNLNDQRCYCHQCQEHLHHLYIHMNGYWWSQSLSQHFILVWTELDFRISDRIGIGTCIEIRVEIRVGFNLIGFCVVELYDGTS